MIQARDDDCRIAVREAELLGRILPENVVLEQNLPVWINSTPVAGIFEFDELDVEEEAKSDNADFEHIDALGVEDSDAIVSGPEDFGCKIGSLNRCPRT